jgi:hypothetical protein
MWQGRFLFTGDVVTNLTQPIDPEMYQLVAQAMLQYGQTFLSTAGMANYLLGAVGILRDDRVLFVGNGEVEMYDNDYLTDRMLHGLQAVMHTPVVDWPRRPGMYHGAGTFTEAQYAASKMEPKRYGGGFSYALRMHEPFGINRANVPTQIKNVTAHFDYVIFGMAHRLWWRKQGICGAMPRHRVVFLWGHDSCCPPSPADLQAMHECGQHILIREMSRVNCKKL